MVKMWRLMFCVIFIYLPAFTLAWTPLKHDICGNDTQRARSCTTQILGDPNAAVDKCQIEYYESNDKCRFMDFGPIMPNTKIGGVRLTPHILSGHRGDNFLSRAVLNITFSNIKWKTMKFRFGSANRTGYNNNHCRDIIISNDVQVDDRSILYYDCYWPIMDANKTGQSHILDFQATDNHIVNRGKYFFKIPSAKMLSETITKEEWQPFLYIELMIQTINLHIVPPPQRFNITAYEIKVMKQTDKGTQEEKVVVKKFINKTEEVIHEYSLLNDGLYYFVVTPQHETCTAVIKDGCQSVISPVVGISIEAGDLRVSIASIIALIVASLFASYVALRFFRRIWCTDYPGNRIPPPTAVMVVSPTANREHAQCVESFVAVLRDDYYFDINYEGDIHTTVHKNPAKWADETFSRATHIMYIAGPTDDVNPQYNKIYNLLLSYIRLNTAEKYNKKVVNIFFEYSDRKLPIETKHSKAKYDIPRDWHKLIADLSKDTLPVAQIMKTDKGKCFLANLKKAKEMKSNLKCDSVVVKSEKVAAEKKVLI